MSEKWFEQKVQACESADKLPFPFDVGMKLKNWCNAPDIQKAIADKKAWRQDLISGGSNAVRWQDSRAAALRELGNS
jgi:hypothetical protein